MTYVSTETAQILTITGQVLAVVVRGSLANFESWSSGSEMYGLENADGSIDLLSPSELAANWTPAP